MSRVMARLGTKSARECPKCKHKIRRYWRFAEHARKCKGGT